MNPTVSNLKQSPALVQGTFDFNQRQRERTHEGGFFVDQVSEELPGLSLFLTHVNELQIERFIAKALASISHDHAEVLKNHFEFQKNSYKMKMTKKPLDVSSVKFNNACLRFGHTLQSLFQASVWELQLRRDSTKQEFLASTIVEAGFSWPLQNALLKKGFKTVAEVYTVDMSSLTSLTEQQVLEFQNFKILFGI